MSKKLPPYELSDLNPQYLDMLIGLDNLVCGYYDEDFECNVLHYTAWTPESLNDFIHRNHTGGYICFGPMDNHEGFTFLTGYTAFELDKWFIHIAAFCVDPNYRRRGYGRVMLNKLYELASRSQYRRTLIVHVHERDRESQEFWKACHFDSKVVRNFFEDGDAFRFEFHV